MTPLPAQKMYCRARSASNNMMSRKCFITSIPNGAPPPIHPGPCGSNIRRSGYLIPEWSV
jgi:hypothetical protein